MISNVTGLANDDLGVRSIWVILRLPVLLLRTGCRNLPGYIDIWVDFCCDRLRIKALPWYVGRHWVGADRPGWIQSLLSQPPISFTVS
jgi:hypothetical protein